MSIKSMELRIAEANCSLIQLEKFLYEIRHLDLTANYQAAALLLAGARLSYEQAVQWQNESVNNQSSTRATAESVIEILLPEIENMIERISSLLVCPSLITD